MPDARCSGPRSCCRIASASIWIAERATFASVAAELGRDRRAVLSEHAAVLTGWDSETLEKAVAIVVEGDRASVPMAEAREARDATDKDTKKGIIQPISVNYRMIFVAPSPSVVRRSRTSVV